jgi:hypothetical protein
VKQVLYGVRGLDVENTAQLIARMLPCTFEERENEFRGTNLVAVTREGELQVSAVYGLKGEIVEDDFQEYNTVVYVDGEETAARLSPLSAPRGPLEGAACGAVALSPSALRVSPRSFIKTGRTVAALTMLPLCISPMRPWPASWL